MASMNSLSDSFDQGISANWSKTDNSADPTVVTAQSGQVRVGHSALTQYNALSTVTSYSLTGSYAFVQVVDFGDQAIPSHEVILSLYKDGTNSVWITASGNLLSAFKLVANVQTQIGSSITLNTHNHRWFRIRESGGTLNFETSPDSQVWKVNWTLANPFAVTAIFAQLQSGGWQNEASASYAMFDYYNVPLITGMENHVRVGDGMSRAGVAN